MNISSKSWHYRLVEHCGTRGAKEKFYLGCHTTCSYIRAVIWAALMGLMMAAFIGGLAAAAALILYSTVAAPIQYLLGVAFEKETFTGLVYVMGLWGWFALAAVSVVSLIKWCYGKYEARRPSAAERASLIKQAYKDKKDGICTLIVVDKE